MRRLFACLTLCALSGCQPKLQRQPRVNPYAAGGARALPEGVVSQESAREETAPALTAEVLEQGRAHFAIYCAVCHGLGGDGDGIAVQRGLIPPPSYHTDFVRGMTINEIERQIAQGKGQMMGMAGRIPARDRWAIAYYVRALQLSRHFPNTALSAKEKP